MNYDLKTLEFNKVLETVSTYAFSSYAKEKLLNLKISDNLEKVNYLLNETEEARLLKIKYQNLPLSGLFDLRYVLNRLRLNSTLKIEDFLDLLSLLQITKDTLSYFKEVKEELKYLNNYVLKLNPLKKLVEEINLVIDPKGEIYDNASSELKTLRHQIKNLDKELRNHMQALLISKAKMLNESLIVIRNERLCLPVKNEYKNVIKGIIHDESSSKSTVYIEPYSALEISNKLVSLKEAEKVEIKKILEALSKKASNFYLNLNDNFYNLCKLDLIYAKASYAINLNCYKPLCNNEGIIDLKEARHPLLKKETCVPIDVKLGKDYQSIIITGPNTGGKTVALKTTGLLTLMAQAGLLIPAKEDSKIAVFEGVYADIGDEQSIEQSLSSFSGHIKKVTEIIDNLKPNSLVLFDELGSGTDPKEGSNLAIAIVLYLLKKNARIIVTTHYENLKAFAYNKKEIINASVEFDLETLKPTYRLLLGIPGSSNAITIAKRLGLNDEITSSALDLGKEDETDLNSLMQTLDEKNRSLTQELINYREEKALLDQELKEVNELKEDLLKNQEYYLKKAQEEAKILIEKAKEEATDLLSEIKKLKEKTDLKEHEIAEMKFLSKSLGLKEKEVVDENYDFKVNDQVMVKSFNQVGTISKVLKDSFEVIVGNFKMNFKKADLAYYKGAKSKLKLQYQKKKTTEPKSLSSNAKLECDLRGFRYEEVKPELDKFIDSAYLAGFSQVYVIHGFGTGAVRKACYEYFKNSPYVKETRFGGEGEGLNGVTVVTLK